MKAGPPRLSTRVVLTDFDRTLALLFDDQAMACLRTDLVSYLSYYTTRRIPAERLATGNPYALWLGTYRWMTDHNWPNAEAVNQGAAEILGEHEARAALGSSLLVGVHPALQRLRDLRAPVVIVSTNATRAVESALRVNGVDHLVSAVVGRAEVVDMDDLKPSPGPVRRALDAAGGGQALLVGDGISDVVAGRRAGVLTVGVTTGECTAAELEAAGADLVIPSFAELPGILLPASS